MGLILDTALEAMSAVVPDEVDISEFAPVDPADGEWALLCDEAAGPLPIPGADADCAGPDCGEDHLGESDGSLWMSRAQAVAAAMDVTVGEPAWTLETLAGCGKASSMIAWCEYREIGAMHRQLAMFGKPEPSPRGARILDVEGQCAARIAMSRGIGQDAAETWLAEAIAMRDRLPLVGLRLRDGMISPRQFRLIVARTELIEGQQWAGAIDHGIFCALGDGRGVWSNRRLRDMVDRIVFRHDPDSVRRRREKAKSDRCAWLLPGADGMASIGATMTAEDAAIAYDAVARLAALACEHDRRSPEARRSDAVFALLSGTRFDCDCCRDDCRASIPEPDTLNAWLAEQQRTAVTKGAVVVHVVAEWATVDGKNDNPGFMDGHGVISAAHLRDILDRDDVRIRPLNKPTAVVENSAKTEGLWLPTFLPSDPYRPSTALDAFVRIRDGYCTVPGCDYPAWACDIDHVTEYDHDAPAQGGRTHPDGLAVKCRMHHLLKTFGHGWIDDQFRDPGGRLVSEVVSPEGIRFPGPAETNQDLFESLTTITWRDPDPPPADVDTTAPPRGRNRLKAKHARRRRERAANRDRRLAEEKINPPPADGDPPF